MLKTLLCLMSLLFLWDHEGHTSCSKMLTDDLRPATVNRIVSETAIATYSILNATCSYPTAKIPLASNSTYWSVGGEGHPTLALNRSVTITKGFLSRAMEDLLKHKPVIECLMAARIVKTMCLKALLDSKFDDYVDLFISQNKITPYAPDIMGRLTDNFILPVHNFVGFTHVINVEAYAELNPEGAESGHNVYQSGKDLHIGFDPVLFGQGPVSGAAIEDSLYQAFMRIPSVASSSHSLKDRKSFDAARHKRQTQLQVHGRIRWYQFDVTRLNAFLMDQRLPTKWW